ncbi:Nudix hydrolase domain-containing protein [Sphingomonas antarctica]|uniref:CoA pyrophosphatase n=1 Tax=Sphingomonas antarctica TaxID=2040274 RepID=UPI0039EB29CB
MTLTERLRARLAETDGEAPLSAGDDSIMSGASVAAAVLIAITDRAEPGLILTQRPDTMRRHPGQVAFPGGRVDPEDADDIAAALREAEEEIALPRHVPEIIATLPAYRTITGFAVTPVVAVIPPDLPLVPHDAEVAAVFEVPLSFALDPASWTERTVMFQGTERRYREAMWADRRIWGATAAMLANLALRLKW